MAGFKEEGRIVDFGSVGVGSKSGSKVIGAPAVGPNGDVPIQEGGYVPRSWMDSILRGAIKDDPTLLRAQQAAVFEAWHRINARKMAGFFGKIQKIQTAMICDYPAMFFELALFVGRDPASGKGITDGKRTVRFATALSEIPEIIAAMKELYERGCKRYGQKIRPIEQCTVNVSGYDDGNPVRNKED